MSSKVVFITGAAKRIGAYLARFLHQQGYRVIINYHQSEPAANQLVTQLNTQRAASACALQADLRQPQAVDQLARQVVEVFGQLDLLINNASAFYPTPNGDFDQQDWINLIGSNLQAPTFLMQALSPALIETQGNIINMLDIHAQRPLKQHGLYSMAKAGLANMTLAMAQELAPRVRVNGIAPGAILWPERTLSEAERQTIVSEIPLGRIGCENDIALGVEYLIHANYVTGHILNIDGGRSIANHATA